MNYVKRQFRQIKKLPKVFFLPVAILIWLMKFTMRFSLSDPCNSLQTSKFPFVTIIWHNRLLFFPSVFSRAVRRRTAAVISASRDGQYLADIVSLFGVTPVRGSSSKKGFAALSESISLIEKGFNVAITPDGPRGPKYKMSNGPVLIASITGRPILPVCLDSSSYWELNSWDKFRIPKPFSELRLILDEPIYIPKDLDDEAIEKWRLVLEKKLNSIGE